MGVLIAAAAVAVCALIFGLLSNFNWRGYHKGQLYGPTWVWPIVGATLYCITDPYGYWITQRNYGKLSWNSLFGKFLILAGDVADCRAVLTQTGYVTFSIPLFPHSTHQKIDTPTKRATKPWTLLSGSHSLQQHPLSPAPLIHPPPKPKQ
jgi:hypothetical protein